MKSFTGLRNLFGSLVNNTETAVLTLGDQWINDGIRIIIASPENYDFLEQTATDVTVASQQGYQTPFNYDKLNSVTITVGTYKYPVKEVSSRPYWDRLNLVTSFTSTYPNWFFIDAGNVNFWPIPSASSNVITYSYEVAVKDLANADYTTGTITLTNGSAAVVGSGTIFTAAMVGRYLKGNNDGYWYQIQSFTDTTHITLRKTFQGTTIAGASYTIGEMPILPEAYQNLPVYYAVSQYWYQNGDFNRGQQYEKLFYEGIEKLKHDHGMKTSSIAINSEEPIINPNFMISFP